MKPVDPENNDKTSGPSRRRREPKAIGIGILAGIAVVAALYLGRGFLVPLLIGILASYALRPVVDWLNARRIPRVIGATLVMAVVVVGLAWAMYSLQNVATSMIEKLPEAAHTIREHVRDTLGNGPTAIQNIKAAAAELQGAANEAAANHAQAKAPANSASPPSTSDTWLRDFMLAQSALLLEVVENAPVVLLLTYFLLASGEHFRSKVTKIVGPSRERKKDVLRILDEIDVQIQRYLIVTLVTNGLIAILTALAFLALGMEQPTTWGVAAGVLHFIPYLGELILAVASGIAAFIQFGTVSSALAVMAAAYAVSLVVGLGIATWLQSRLARVNAAVLFIALLFFGWLWGIWGLLLGAPLVAIAKVICDRVDWLRPAGELMGP